MRDIAEMYTEEVYQNLRPLFANWEPGTPVELGDYGLLRGRTFIHLGNIKDKGLTFQVRSDPTKDTKGFTSKGKGEVKLHAKGSVPVSGVISAKAGLEVSFSSEDAVFFNAAECACSMIRDKAALGQQIMALYRKHEWKRAWVVITDVVQAGSTTIAISGSGSSSITFEADGDVEKINLADASIRMSLSRCKDIGYHVDAKEGLIPLLGLSGIKSTFLWFDDVFKPLSRMMTPLITTTFEESDEIRTEENPNQLHFGQLMQAAGGTATPRDDPGNCEDSRLLFVVTP